MDKRNDLSQQQLLSATHLAFHVAGGLPLLGSSRCSEVKPHPLQTRKSLTFCVRGGEFPKLRRRLKPYAET